MATSAGDLGDERPAETRKTEHPERTFEGIFREREPVACPYCKSTHTECVALFGPVRLTSQYYCRGCHSAFEVVKD